MVETKKDEPATVLISGAGIAGLALAIGLHKKCGIPGDQIEVYESARAFTSDAGGAIGLYANGLRVVRDFSPQLHSTIRMYGHDYIYRRWLRHDGSEVACAKESALADDPGLQSLGIRRWKLQKALFDEAAACGIVVQFRKRTDKVGALTSKGIEVTFADGTSRFARLVFGADGVKSKVREVVVGSQQADFTGVSVLMGAAKVPVEKRGILFPSSATTKNHACYYAVGDSEQIFQIYFPTPTLDDENWGTLSKEDGAKEGLQLAAKLRKDGWAEEFVRPLEKAESVIRLGLFAREPFDKWVSDDHNRRVILLGDAAHPPVPYIGQGAQMAFEDCGVLCHLLRETCCKNGTFDPSDANIAAATRLYEQIRIPRAKKILGSSHKLGATQQLRADSKLYNLGREMFIKMQVALYGTLTVMKPGPAYDFAKDVSDHLNGDAKTEPPARSTMSVVLPVVAVVAAGAALAFLKKK